MERRFPLWVEWAGRICKSSITSVTIWVALNLCITYYCSTVYYTFMVHFVLLHYLLWGKYVLINERVTAIEDMINTCPLRTSIAPGADVSGQADSTLTTLNPPANVSSAEISRSIDIGPFFTKLRLLDTRQRVESQAFQERLNEQAQRTTDIISSLDNMTGTLNAAWKNHVQEKKDLSHLMTCMDSIAREMLSRPALEKMREFTTYAQHRKFAYLDWHVAVVALFKALLVEEKGARVKQDGEKEQMELVGMADLVQLSRV
ncbi:hypothetical protein FB567DRAFT_591082 [Paraphoma chrysanthemicola]|uniref:Uncharacterized protein n=1 Tax=Paraphoma chrysanthemicola TaxID=798071 RepID=A0A8K0R9D6_9PLEO|nr:hypothetical protein FB567DRAFT_591082 [Paraphoma chrysanthemicola]